MTNSLQVANHYAIAHSKEKALANINAILATWDGSPTILKVCNIKAFDRVYSGTPLDVGTIEIAYHDQSVARVFGDSRPDNNHALFGVRADGTVTVYAN